MDPVFALGGGIWVTAVIVGAYGTRTDVAAMPWPGDHRAVMAEGMVI